MDAPTAGVLRDVTLLASLAMLAGSAAYKWLRVTRPSECWHWSGRVDARPYTGVDAVVVAALTVMIFGVLGMPETAEPAEAAKQHSELSAPMVMAGIVVQLIGGALLLFYLGGVRGLSPAALFGLRGRSWPRVLGAAVLLMPPTLVLVNALAEGMAVWMQSFWPEMQAQEAVRAFRDSDDPVARGALVLAAVVVAPLVEELAFRGFIYGFLKRFTDGWFAALCSSLLFAVAHFHVGSLFPLALLALILCAAYEITGSLLAPMLMHALFNTTSLLLLVYAPEMTTP
ncbi:MAG TPA: hypothetical protein DIT64_11225 [Verrucomicrobiales bacterium]|nr:hypothetical protein [Verrucomicrobiales bacterium]HRK17305.1 CPBP family intramembrane metalloprotease [Prosthecobacter sp.]